MRIVRGRGVAVTLLVFVLLVVGLVYGLASSFGTSSSPSAATGKLVLKLGYLTPPDSLNPFVGYSNSAYEVWCLNYDFLVGYAPDGSSRPGIAESWSTSPDGKTWVFKIRHGMTWQDGQPITARDVAFTFNYIVKKKLAAYNFYTTLITDAVATDNYTCEVHCSKPKADMTRLYMYVFPEHIWSKVADPEKYTMTYPIIGSGPFQCVENKEGSFVRMEKNPSYWGPKPTIDEILFQYYTNQDTMVQEFRNGSLDGAYDIPPAQYPSVSSTSGVQGYKANVYYLEYLSFNCYDDPASQGNPVLKDVKFRQALNWAVDKTELVKIGLSGYGLPGTTMIPPGEWPADFNAHYEPTPEEAYHFDIAKANSLLDAAGYTDTNGDGTRDYRGKPISLRLWSRSDSVPSQKEGKLLTDWFKQCKLKIDYVVMDPGTMSDKLYAYNSAGAYAPDYDIYLWDSYGYADPGDTLAGLTTAQIQMWNDPCWSNAQYDALNVQQMSELNTQKRLDLLHQMQDMIYTQSPYIILTYPQTLIVADTKRWEGWTTFMGAPFFNGFNMDSYSNLKPKSQASTSGSSSNTTTWIVVGVIAAIVAIVVVALVMRRGRERVEEA